MTLLVGGLIVLTAPVLPGGEQSDSRRVEQQAAPDGLRVFYASHSLMWYVPKPLAELTEAAGIEGHQLVGVQSLGASKTIQHWELPDDKNEAKKALRGGEVDVFVMSPISFPDEGIENFVKLGLEHNPHMRFIVQLSWGGGDVDNQDFPQGSFNHVNKEKTPEQLQNLFARNIKAGKAQVDAINTRYGQGRKIVAMVPSAQAMLALRTKIANQEWPGLTRQSELFVDAVHASVPMMTLNAYLHFAVLYGQSPVGLPMPTALRNAKREAWDNQFNRALQELAWEIVTGDPHSLVTDSPEQ